MPNSATFFLAPFGRFSFARSCSSDALTARKREPELNVLFERRSLKGERREAGARMRSRRTHAAVRHFLSFRLAVSVVPPAGRLISRILVPLVVRRKRSPEFIDFDATFYCKVPLRLLLVANLEPDSLRRRRRRDGRAPSPVWRCGAKVNETEEILYRIPFEYK